MNRVKNWLSKAVVVITVGGMSGFVVAAMVAAVGISFHAVLRSESPIWSLGDLYFVLALASVVGTPAGVIAFAFAYATVLRGRIRARELSTPAISTFAGGVAGSAILLPLAIFAAPLAFALGCMLLSRRAAAVR